MKYIIGVLSAMILVTIILGTYQWTEWSESESSIEDSTPLMKVDLREHNEYISVEQTFTQGLNGEFEVEVPANASDFLCTKSDGEDCAVSENSIQVVPDDSLTFSFQLPIEELGDELLFVKDWWVRLAKDGEPVGFESHIQMTGLKQKESKWLMSRSPEYVNQLETINYYEWNFNKHEPLNLMKVSNLYSSYEDVGPLQVHSTIPVKISPLKEVMDIVPFETPFLLVISPSEKSISQPGMASIPSLEKRKVASAMLDNHLLSTSSDMDRRTMNVLSQYFYLNEPKNEHEAAMVRELKKVVSESEKSQWLEEMSAMQWTDENISRKMDRMLSNIFNVETEFFTLNKDAEEPVPFYGKDNRSIRLDGKAQEVEWDSIIYRESSYIPIAGLSELLDFRIVGLSEGDELFINYNSDRYRFFLDQDVFIVNEESYGVEEDLLVQIGKEVYIKSERVADILSFDLTLRDQWLNIKK
ncbi:hypothetical protein CEY16_01805 [Halalkalibacillus sediminis]|uniref:Copper amine oxidase-like N-terminal domain-containing protein n=1 Tax=Halalkalibacillus sediminis TaxID=2018042 RepID=A0A2I0QW12_9BACI|nr:hypothetical protein [Halalkalibacillus sediminis]PKR78515.1 hypothetical protein CEY16_01805 [Halalkalibacillus sediminis]